MNKEVHPYKDARKLILEALQEACGPVRQTLSPKGRNVIYEDNAGAVKVTNDGVTIIRNTYFRNPVKNAILELIKHAALNTNQVAGDGTTTSVLLTQDLIQEGFKVIDNNINPMMLVRSIKDFSKALVEEIKKNYVKKIKTDSDLLNIAKISSNNDNEIAKNVVEAIKKAGDEGLILINDNTKTETEIVHDEGFFMDSGLLAPVFATQ